MERIKNVEEFTVRDVIPSQYQNRDQEDIVRPGVVVEPATVTSGRYNGNNIDGNARFRSRPTLGTGTAAGRVRTAQVRPPQLMPVGIDRDGSIAGLAGLGNFITENPMRALLIAGAAVGVWWFCKKSRGSRSGGSRARAGSSSQYAAII
jgi:hypothetical protein